MVVTPGDVGRRCGLPGTLAGVSVLSAMWLELESAPETSPPRRPSVHECQSAECAPTSPVTIESGMLVMYCMQPAMSVSAVSTVSCRGVAVSPGAMYMLAMAMSPKCFVCILSSCISVLSVPMVCGVLRCVNVASDLTQAMSPPPRLCCLSVRMAVQPGILGVRDVLLSFDSCTATTSGCDVSSRCFSSSTVLPIPPALSCRIFSLLVFSFVCFLFVVCVGVCRRGDAPTFVWWGNEGRVGTDRLHLV